MQHFFLSRYGDSLQNFVRFFHLYSCMYSCLAYPEILADFVKACPDFVQKY